ncbi:DUF5696 domain-containing protein [Paenibacillus sp. BC26]|uniref:DUF5696 domain-containing protein n=1 Tax=Paenibacillus sp. BC26 TaxID=1881032 RepID=UPI0008E63101|nr:DUF5696 domain-containing protein [Paenibacillus sp. BC26]SFT05237.1 hypothetical protein SAMN05428962_4003 [Paenibacillus sp. BC26]
MTGSRLRLSFLITGIVIVAVLAGLALQFHTREDAASEGTAAAAESDNSAAAASFKPKAGTAPFKSELPADGRFRQIAENVNLTLSADKETGHFRVVSKQTGKVWFSYPDPAQWPNETIGGAWKNNLLSPVIVEYMDLSNYKSASRTVGLVDEGGYVEDFKATENGFAVTFVLSKGSIKIPVEVTLKEDSVETTIRDEQIVEAGKFSLLNAKLYPLFGGQFSQGQDGYIFVPDGSGALIRFKTDRVLPQLTFNQPVYGYDGSFYFDQPNRQRLSIPVFGLKSGDQAFAAVITEGAEYANVFAAPSGSIGLSNWVTAEWQYRKRFFQSVSKSTDAGFFTYSEQRFEAPRRTVRYYLLPPDQSDYVGMAAKYRDYLTAGGALHPISEPKKDIPLYMDIVGGDIEQGLLFDSYLTATTTKEAKELVASIYDRGVHDLVVQYSGWQQDGYSTHGGYFPAESKLGGSKGMRAFIDYAHTLDIPVYLTANYTINNNGDDGFWYRRDGQRDLSGNTLSAREDTWLVSPRFYSKVIASDLSEYKKLGADGIVFDGGGIGYQLNTDFNGRYAASRADGIGIQRDIFKQAKETLGSVSAVNANAYVWEGLKHIPRLADSYSFDVFVDEVVPFTQIVLHGAVTYTSEWANVRQESRTEFLRGIEYGAYPTYVFAAAPSDKLRHAYSIWYYSLNYRDWLDSLSEEYARANEALRDVQDKRIIGHRSISEDVKETTYEGGQRVIVNYGASAYAQGELRVPAQDFAVVKGGLGP